MRMRREGRTGGGRCGNDNVRIDELPIERRVLTVLVRCRYKRMALRLEPRAQPECILLGAYASSVVPPPVSC